MPITIQEIIASDTISQLVDKTNFNFDQLLLNGGGPAGPAGPIGPVGPAGGRGPKGSTWYDDLSTTAPGNNPNTVPPTPMPATGFLPGDYYLQFNGQVWEYSGLTWGLTTIDLQGPIGPQGASGGFGLDFGSPSINQQTAIYNGPFGEGNGATGGPGGNEGVPSVMIGGAVSTTSSLPTIPLTNAYIIPNTIAEGLISTTASLMIHQKDSTAKSIVFHGGAAQAGDNYNQNDIGSLSNISIGIDDRLVLNVPKVATSPTNINELVGFEVNIPTRSHQYTAGKAISFQTGIRNQTDFAGENSDFTINVGTGSAAAGNKFVVQTAGTTASGLIQLGTNFAVNTQQNAQVGVAQIQAGLINLTSSVNNNIQLNAGGNLRLTTRLSSNPSGAIDLRTGSGGYLLDTNNGGNITLIQSDNSNTAEGDIFITNTSTAPNSIIGGDIYITGNSQLILRKENTTALQKPSIVIDYGYDGGAGAQPHTRFVGRQTIAGEGLAGGTFPPQSFGNLIYKNPSGQATTASSIFELTGNNGVLDYSPGAMLQAWTGGVQSISGLDAGLLAVAMGSEGPSSPVPSANFAWDNTLGFTVRDSGNVNEYFTASKNKIAFAAPWVLKRGIVRNSSINNAPYVTQSASSTMAAPLNYGWNTRQTTTPQAASGNNYPSLGMPQTEELTVPYITLAFGPGFGYTDAGASFNSGNIAYDYKVAFPIGAYPGQRLLVKLYVQALTFITSTPGPGGGGGNITVSNYGQVDLRIPMQRVKSPATNGAWTSWWGTGNNIPFGTKPGFQVVTVTTDSTDAGLGVGRFRMIDMIWDGQITQQTGAEVNNAGPNTITTRTQHGWAIISASMSTTDSNIVSISGYDNAPQCFVTGTEIALSNGDTKNIEDIIPGDKLVTWNETSKMQEVGTVGGLDIMEEVGMVVVLTFDNGSTIKVTEHHPFYHIDNDNVGLIDAADLRTGFEVYQLNGEKAKVVSVSEEQGLYTVYNITDVSGNHNYYANKILVHNK